MYLTTSKGDKVCGNPNKPPVFAFDVALTTEITPEVREVG